jgi:hypothetical protein
MAPSYEFAVEKSNSETSYRILTIAIAPHNIEPYRFSFDHCFLLISIFTLDMILDLLIAVLVMGVKLGFFKNGTFFLFITL